MGVHVEIAKLVARRIKIARAERDMNQEELAEVLNISQKAVSKWERGNTNIGVITLSRIADALQKPIEYFFMPLDEPAVSRFANEQRETYNVKKEQARRKRAA